MVHCYITIRRPLLIFTSQLLSVAIYVHIYACISSFNLSFPAQHLATKCHRLLQCMKTVPSKPPPPTQSLPRVLKLIPRLVHQTSEAAILWGRGRGLLFFFQTSFCAWQMPLDMLELHIIMMSVIYTLYEFGACMPRNHN